MTHIITHRTIYGYDTEVSESFGLLHLLPRDLAVQTCLASAVTVDPAPEWLTEHRDHFGNRVNWFSVLEPHTSLTITTKSEVAVIARPTELPLGAEQPWERARDGLAQDLSPGGLVARPFLLDSPLVTSSAALATLAAPAFTPGRSTAEAVIDLSHRIHDGFAYEPGATTVRTTLEEVLAQRRGVCQDFAHVLVGCARSVGLAARYVSGYLETRPPPGRPRLVGADASHAWASVYLPDAGWLDVDPTNDMLVGDRHITTAWGRDYSDIPPVRGVIFTESKASTLDVQVDVLRS